jgi:hypothetical protein
MVMSYIYSICWCMELAFYERQHLADGPVGAPSAQHVGLAAIARFGGRSQLVAVEPSLSQMASHWAFVGRSCPGPGWEWSRNGASGHTLLVVRRRWRESPPADGTACPPHR